jgi:hypothetical protein
MSLSYVPDLTVHDVHTHTHNIDPLVFVLCEWLTRKHESPNHSPTFPSFEPPVIPQIQHLPSHNAVVRQIHGNAIQSLCTVWKTIQYSSTLTYWRCLSMIDLPYYVINTVSLTWFVLCSLFVGLGTDVRVEYSLGGCGSYRTVQQHQRALRHFVVFLVQNSSAALHKCRFCSYVSST